MNIHVLKEVLSSALSLKIKSINQVSGGDISDAFCLESNQGKFFLKVNQEEFALDMFQKEKIGLEQIASYNIVKVPEIYKVGQVESSAFLLMEFINSESKQTANFKQFGIQLAELHLQFGDTFGWEFDNYIGSLLQKNSKSTDWSEFYTFERLIPQIKMAIDQKLLDTNSLPTSSNLQDACSRLFQDSKPSPIHGDLWSGNYIADSAGNVYLIDPAFYFGYHEIDIAMSKLFGGFPNEFYEGYHSVFPTKKDHSERIQFLQLYYLLVHLNLFGRPYLASVMRILNKYSQ